MERTISVGVFSSHAGCQAAVGRLDQLATTGVSAALALLKDPAGEVETREIELPGGTAAAGSLELETVKALERIAGVDADAGSPAAELGHSLTPGAAALAVFVDPDRVAAVDASLEALGARVLTADEMQRVGARLAGAPSSGTLAPGDGAAKPSAPAPAPVFDWQAEYAYSLALQAFIYGFPYLHLAQLRHKWVAGPNDPGHTPHAAVGRFSHAPNLVDASYQDGGCPNNDTLYSVSWVDLGGEPVILSHPEMGDRYFSFELASINSDNFAYVGQRATGPRAGDFAIVGPGWKGELPAGVKRTDPSPTPWIFCLGRTLVDGPGDVPKARELMDRYELTPLSLWGEDAAPPERRDVLEPVPLSADPLGPWKALNSLLEENPPPERHAPLLGQFAAIGVGPGIDVEAQPDVVKESLVKAAGAGMKLLRQHFLSGAWATDVNGWRYPPPILGRAGDHGDFLLRAAAQALAGIVANDPAEAVYMANMDDADGGRLSGESRYELQLRGDELPPVDAFWSLTLYKADMNLAPNAADRYSIGDRTPGLRRDPDGGVTIPIQAENPGGEAEANWLPCPAEGAWFVVLRLYRPRREVVNASWRCPPIRRVA